MADLTGFPTFFVTEDWDVYTEPYSTTRYATGLVRNEATVFLRSIEGETGASLGSTIIDTRLDLQTLFRHNYTGTALFVDWDGVITVEPLNIDGDVDESLQDAVTNPAPNVTPEQTLPTAYVGLATILEPTDLHIGGNWKVTFTGTAYTITENRQFGLTATDIGTGPRVQELPDWQQDEDDIARHNADLEWQAEPPYIARLIIPRENDHPIITRRIAELDTGQVIIFETPRQGDATAFVRMVVVGVEHEGSLTTIHTKIFHCVGLTAEESGILRYDVDRYYGTPAGRTREFSDAYSHDYK